MKPTFEHTWIIDKFSEKLNWRYMYSSIFSSTNDVKFYLSLCCWPSYLNVKLILHKDNKAKLVHVKAELSFIEPNGKKSDLLEIEGMADYDKQRFVGILINRKQILTGDYLKDDKLTIHCKGFCSVDLLGIFSAQDTNNSLSKLIIASESRKFQQNILGLLETGKFSDVTLIASDCKRFTAHKAILAAHSPVFEAMFQHEDTKESVEGSVDIIDINGEVMEELLRFIYTGQYRVLDFCAEELFVAADKYQLDQLKMIIEKVLCETVNDSNAFELYKLADMHNAFELKENCFPLMIEQMMNRIDSLSGPTDGLIEAYESVQKMEEKVDHYSTDDDDY